MNRLKQHLALIFDDNLETVKWKNVVDYTIIGLIVLSTVEIFLSTYDDIVEKYSFWLNLVDYFTIGVFTVEVTLRIWCADILDEKYKGFWGRVRYCLTFYGLVDVLSTYTFYLAMLFPIPYMAFKVLRVLRLVRIFRYIKAFNILSRAISSKKNELLVSLEFLVIVTLMLSFVLYFVEHDVQPEVYENGWISVLWAFMQYVGDPGSFADTPPVTTLGHVIAVIIGLLGIAIFAVPAGLIGSAFSEVMEEDQANEDIANDIESLRHSFKMEKDLQHTGLLCVPRYMPMLTILTRKFMTEERIIKAVENSEIFHLYNLANAVNKQDNPKDSVVVINCFRNTVYGGCIDRGSRVTIVSTSGSSEPMSSWYAYHLAKLAGFNYVAKEVEVDPDNQVSYYNIPKGADCPNLKPFLDDIDRLSSRPGSWVVPILGAIGLKDRPTQYHFCYNTKKHDASYNDPKARIKDYQTFDRLYNKVEEAVEKYDRNLDKNEWYVINSENVAHHIKADNVFTLRVECFMYVFQATFLEEIKAVADAFHEALEPEVHRELPPEMLKRVAGHDFGMQDYVN